MQLKWSSHCWVNEVGGDTWNPFHIWRIASLAFFYIFLDCLQMDIITKFFVHFFTNHSCTPYIMWFILFVFNLIYKPKNWLLVSIWTVFLKWACFHHAIVLVLMIFRLAWTWSGGGMMSRSLSLLTLIRINVGKDGTLWKGLGEETEDVESLFLNLFVQQRTLCCKDWSLASLSINPLALITIPVLYKNYSW